MKAESIITRLVVLSKREEFPNIMTGSTTTDYKTGLTVKSQTLAFDFYSGAPTKVLTKDSYGNQFLTVSEAAYHHYPSMGLKVGNHTNS